MAAKKAPAKKRAGCKRTSAKKAAPKSTKNLPYARRTLKDLYALAKERNIPGRSSMNKEQLIAALKKKR